MGKIRIRVQNTGLSSKTSLFNVFNEQNWRQPQLTFNKTVEIAACLKFVIHTFLFLVIFLIS